MKQKRGTLVLAAVLVVALVAAGIGYRALTAGRKPAGELAAQQSGGQTVPLPDFTVVDSGGNAVASAALTGKPMVINFWATWCGYCVEEMPDFQAAYETYGDKVSFAMINVTDGRRETKEIADAYIAAHGFTFPVYYDTKLAGVNACGVTGYPTSLFVSAEGQVLLAWPGKLEAKQLGQLLEAMLQ